MAYVYILYSMSRDRYYIGSTDNLKRRISEHDRGKTTATRGGKPWIPVFSHMTSTLTEARRLERHIKALHRRDYIETIIQDQYLYVGVSVPT